MFTNRGGDSCFLGFIEKGFESFTIKTFDNANLKKWRKKMKTFGKITILTNALLLLFLMITIPYCKMNGNGELPGP